MNINVRIRNENFHGGFFLRDILGEFSCENCEKMINENLLGFLSIFEIWNWKTLGNWAPMVFFLEDL
jgi:hypothetical protein